MQFVGREIELAQLERWWTKQRRFALVWGRRRVGKTALITRFAEGRRTVLYTGTGLTEAAELRSFSRRVAQQLPHPQRSLDDHNPFRFWDEALEYLAAQAENEPLLLVLDEFPELLKAQPALPGILRAFWDRYESRTKLRVLLCGSAVRTMFSLQDTREPLYGRFDLALPVYPFAPHEAAQMLPALEPRDRALAYGIVGGMPLYLSWWEQGATVAENLELLCLQPGSPLQTEARLILTTEAGEGSLPSAVLTAIAGGCTKYNEIATATAANPTRALAQLAELKLIRPVVPVTETERSKRRYYQITDNFLAFYLGTLARYNDEIQMGHGHRIVSALLRSASEHLGVVYEEAFRAHLRRLAAADELGDDVTAIGPWWSGGGQHQIDAVVLAEPERTRVPSHVGEVKWSASVNAGRIRAKLYRKAVELTGQDNPDLTYIVCARDGVTHGDRDIRQVTACDIFTPELRPLAVTE